MTRLLPLCTLMAMRAGLACLQSGRPLKASAEGPAAVDGSAHHLNDHLSPPLAMRKN